MRVAVAGCSDASLRALDALRNVAPHSEVIVVEVNARRASKCVEFVFGSVKCIDLASASKESVDVVIDGEVMDLESLNCIKPTLGYITSRCVTTLNGVTCVNIWSLVKALLERVGSTLKFEKRFCRIGEGSCAILLHLAEEVLRGNIECVETGGVKWSREREEIVFRDAECAVLKGLAKLVEAHALSMPEAIELVTKYCKNVGVRNVEITISGSGGRGRVEYFIRGDLYAIEEALLEVSLDALVEGIKAPLNVILSREAFVAKTLSKLILKGVEVDVRLYDEYSPDGFDR